MSAYTTQEYLAHAFGSAHEKPNISIAAYHPWKKVGRSRDSAMTRELGAEGDQVWDTADLWEGMGARGTLRRMCNGKNGRKREYIETGMCCAVSAQEFETREHWVLLTEICRTKLKTPNFPKNDSFHYAATRHRSWLCRRYFEPSELVRQMSSPSRSKSLSSNSPTPSPEGNAAGHASTTLPLRRPFFSFQARRDAVARVSSNSLLHVNSLAVSNLLGS